MLTFRCSKPLSETDRGRLMGMTRPFRVLVDNFTGDDGEVAEMLTNPRVCGLLVDTHLEAASHYADALLRSHVDSVRYNTSSTTALVTAIVELLRTKPRQLKDLRVNLAAFLGTGLFEALAASEVKALHLYDMPTPAQAAQLLQCLPPGLRELGLYQETAGMRALLDKLLERPIERLVLRGVGISSLVLSDRIKSLTFDVQVLSGDDMTFITPMRRALDASQVTELTLHSAGNTLSKAAVKLVMCLKGRLRRVRFAGGGPRSASVERMNGNRIAQLLRQVCFPTSAIDLLDLGDFRVEGADVVAGIEAIFHSSTSRLRHLHLDYGHPVEVVQDLIERVEGSRAHLLQTVDLKSPVFAAFWEQELRGLQGLRNMQALILASDEQPGRYINSVVLRDVVQRFLAPGGRRPS